MARHTTPTRPTPPGFEPPVLTGPILTRYEQLKGAEWGLPVAFRATRDQRGKMASFWPPTGRDGRGPDRFIYWTPQTGAHEMIGVIAAAWHSYKGHAGLGYPTSGLLKTHDGVGLYQRFENCVYHWHPATGVHEVHGAILDVYSQLGGSQWAYPTTDETIARDGRGRFNHFRNPSTGEEFSIYWTAEHGAFVMQGPIRTAWHSYTGPSALGYPTTNLMTTHDNVGRYQNFGNATYVWHPTTGAHEVTGAIRDLYGQLGGSAWAYPTTGETKAAPPPMPFDQRGQGRFNHFRHVDSGEERSIYWWSKTGAHPVTGAIRQRWDAAAWERGPLGYPRGAATAWPEGGQRSLQQAFQGGRILWRASDGHTYAVTSEVDDFSVEVSPKSGNHPLTVKMRVSPPIDLWVWSIKWEVRRNGQTVQVYPALGGPFFHPFTFQASHTFTQPGQYEAIATIAGVGREGSNTVAKPVAVSVGSSATGGGTTTNKLNLLVDTDLSVAQLNSGRFWVTGPGAPAGVINASVQLHTKLTAAIDLPKPPSGQSATYQVRAEAEFSEKADNGYIPAGSRASQEPISVTMTTGNRMAWFSLQKDQHANDFMIKNVATV